MPHFSEKTPRILKRMRTFVAICKINVLGEYEKFIFDFIGCDVARVVWMQQRRDE